MTTSHPEPQPTYRHTQVGILPIMLWLTVTASCVVMGLSSHLAALWITGVILAIVGLGMSFLTTTVTPGHVEVVFGPKLYRRRIAVADIISAEPARSSPWEGWGVRITGEGLLYNITGDEAVRIHLRSGKQLRIGTDDVTGLVAAITAAVRGLPLPTS